MAVASSFSKTSTGQLESNTTKAVFPDGSEVFLSFLHEHERNAESISSVTDEEAEVAIWVKIHDRQNRDSYVGRCCDLLLHGRHIRDSNFRFD